MPDGIDIGILRTRAELAALAPQWSALCRHQPHATPFQSPEWLLPWARQFARRDLRAVTIRHCGRLIGLLPAYVYTEPRRRERHLLLLGAGTSDYLDGVFAPACTAEHIRAALDALQSNADWDAAYFTQLHPESRLLHALEAAPAIRAEPANSQSCARMPAVHLENLPTKIRQNVRYYGNRARRLGSLEFHSAGVADCLKCFEIFRRLHSERWQHSGESGVLTDPRVIAWHRESLPLLARAGMLRLCTLTLNEEPIAAVYALIDPPAHPSPTLYVYLPAFSVRHAALRPGTLLLAQIIDQAAKEGVRTIDFLRGDEPYKHLWHAESAPTFGFALHAGATLTRAA